MPSIQLYQTEEDEMRLMTEALADGCSILPDSNYSTPEAEVIQTLDGYRRARLDERHFFLLHERFKRLPIYMRKIIKDGKNVYYISPSQGGPFLEFLGGGIVEDEKTHVKHIRSGFLAFSSGYWDAAITKKETSPPELAETYKQLTKTIRSTSTRIKPDKSIYWLGNDAKARLLSGARLGLHENWVLPCV